MIKLNKWEKTELLHIYKRERSDLRCLLTQSLKETADNLTDELNISIKTLRHQLQTLEKERDNILKENHLYDFDGTTNYTCKISILHPLLVDFDKETNTEIRKIIKGE